MIHTTLTKKIPKNKSLKTYVRLVWECDDEIISKLQVDNGVIETLQNSVMAIMARTITSKGEENG